MSNTLVEKRYAEALFELGTEKLILDKMVEEFGVVRDAFKQSPEIIDFLGHPKINNEKKKELIDQVFNGFEKDVVNTLKLLVERKHSGIISAIIDQLEKLVHDAKGIAEATVYSVRELSKDEKLKIKQTFVKRLNKNEIKINNVVDPSIIGGVKIRVGNTIYDGSISGKLKRFERNLVTAN